MTLSKRWPASELVTSQSSSLITKGYVADKAVSDGFEKERLTEIAISVFDEVTNETEIRAVTIISLAEESHMFIRRSCDIDEVELTSSSKVVILSALRKSDASPADWEAFGTTTAFDAYVCSILGSAGVLSESIIH